MTLLTPWMLLGIALIGAPILIHLLNRPKYRPAPWGAMRFLREATARRRRRIKLEQRALLALRCLLILLLVVALARPVLRVGRGETAEATTNVIVFDGSYSMRLGESRDQAFAKARETALAIVDAMTDRDNALLVWAGARPRLLSPRPLFEREELREQIRALQPGLERADLPRALEQALWALRTSTLPRHRVIVLTDGLATGWDAGAPDVWDRVRRELDAQKIAPFLHVVAEPPEARLRNLSVADLRTRQAVVDIHRPVDLVADIRNHTLAPQQVDVVFRLDGVEMERRALALSAGINVCLFATRIATPGSHALEVEVREDDLPLDNRRALAVEVRRALPVLVVEGRAGATAFDSDGALVAWALEAGGRGDQGLFAVMRVQERELAAWSFEQLLRYKVVVLANPASLPAALQALLERYVQDGGGLFVGLGGRVAPETLNRLYGTAGGLLPARIGERVDRRANPVHPTFPAGQANETLRLFDTTRTRALVGARMEQYHVVEPAEGAEVAAFADAHPLLVFRPFGQGAVALWTSSLGLEWNRLAATPDFVPLLQNLALYLGSRVIPPVNLRQGETLTYSWTRERAALDEETAAAPLPAPAGATLRLPDGTAHPLPLVTRLGERIGYWTDTLQPGIYRVQADGVPDRCYAVTLPADEALPDVLAAPARSALHDRVPLQFADNLAELRRRMAGEGGTTDLSDTFLWLALAALTGELLLSRRFSG